MNKIISSAIVIFSNIASLWAVTMTSSFTTPYKCHDNSYALIVGDSLTFMYDYGLPRDRVHSFHMHETKKGEHFFNYEATSLDPRPIIKKRLDTYNFTDNGIELGIKNLTKQDTGTYQGEVEEANDNFDYAKSAIEIEAGDIHDPPESLNIMVPPDAGEIHLEAGFEKREFGAKADSYDAIDCNSVVITWELSSKGPMHSCHAEDPKDATDCPFTLKEEDMQKGECATLEVYAKQYGVQSQKVSYKLCYEKSNVGVIVGIVVAVVAAIVIIVGIVLFILKKRSNSRGLSEKTSPPNDGNEMKKLGNAEETEPLGSNRDEENATQKTGSVADV